jgi:hypothetical protein
MGNIALVSSYSIGDDWKLDIMSINTERANDDKKATRENKSLGQKTLS